MGAMAMTPCFTECCADSRRRSVAVVVRFVLPEEEGCEGSEPVLGCARKLGSKVIGSVGYNPNISHLRVGEISH